jgi:HK97 family phage prohead protease
MTDISILRAEAARARRAAADGGTTSRAALPCDEPQRLEVKFASEFRAETVEKDGQEFVRVEGYASMVERGYEMWDFFGPYDEVVSRDAFDQTLAAKPMVVFRFNHGGTAMATTRNGRLELSADTLGLRTVALLNPKRTDVNDLITAIRDQDVTEQSFMFTITDGEWNDSFDEFRIKAVDLDRGDVGPVTYGANPHTLIAARSGEFLDAIPEMPLLVAREAAKRLRARPDLAGSNEPAPEDAEASGGNLLTGSIDTPEFRAFLETLAKVKPEPEPEPEGMSLSLARAQLDLDLDRADKARLPLLP